MSSSTTARRADNVAIVASFIAVHQAAVALGIGGKDRRKERLSSGRASI
jgi:hypothetical protein